ncbi:MAG: methyltransferase domain-containing protein [Rhabdochlamydiaceae bacterium]|jgi:tetratricopeptide (TPR) repeat protein
MRPGPVSSVGGYARGYDEVFAIFENQTTEKNAHQTQITAWLNDLGLQNRRLIDIGCGNGAQLKAIADAIPLGSVTAIDNQAGSIEKAQALLGKPTWEFKQMSAFSPLNISPADIFLLAHFYCAPDKINSLLDNLQPCEKPNSLYILIHSAPQSDTGTLCSKLSFLRPRPAQHMSESFETALKDRGYTCEPHIVEAQILFPKLTPSAISTILNLPIGGYEDAAVTDPDVRIIKALMEFIAGFPLEAFSLEERQLYIQELENLFQSNGGSFLKICNRIILAHPETASQSFAQTFKKIHGDILDTNWPLMMEGCQRAYDQVLLAIDQKKYDEAEDVLTHWLKQLNLFHRNPTGDSGKISFEMSKGYLLLARILMDTKKHMAALAVAWYALRIDPSCEKQTHTMIETIEEHYLATLSIRSPIKWLKQAEEDRNMLNKLRSGIHEKLNSIEKFDLDIQTPALRILYQQITKEMGAFFCHLLEGVEKDLKDRGMSPPCAYAVAGLGSFAREEITPYSDLEFMVITESDEESLKEYFRIMTSCFHARIINLGETILPSLGIRSLHWLFDDETNRGIAFDGNMSTAAKTPHGKQLGKKGDYELIGSVSHFLRFQTNWMQDTPEDRLWATTRYHLPTVLSNAAYIQGDKHLVETYQIALPAVTDHSLTLDLLQHDLTTFNPEIGKEEASGKMHDVKKNLYRLPTTILDSLARHFQLKSHSSWERVEELKDRNIFSKEAAADLLKLLMEVQALRLKAYFVQKAQKDDLPPGTDLYPFYYIAIPFVDAVKRFYEAVKQGETNNEKYLNTPRFFDNTPFCQGCVARRLLDYRKAEFLLEKDPRDTPLYLRVLADVKKELYKLDEAAKLYQKLIHQLPKEESELILSTRIKLAQVLQEQAHYSDAQIALAEAEKISIPL